MNLAPRWERNCVTCQCPIGVGHKKRKYCSDACADQKSLERSRERYDPNLYDRAPPRNCVICGNVCPIQPAGRGPRYKTCSPPCFEKNKKNVTLRSTSKRTRGHIQAQTKRMNENRKKRRLADPEYDEKVRTWLRKRYLNKKRRSPNPEKKEREARAYAALRYLEEIGLAKELFNDD